MNCKNCGFPLTNDNDKCPSCGTPNELFNRTVDPVQNATSIQDAPISEPTGPAIQSTPVIPTMSNESTKIDDDIFMKSSNEESLGTPIQQMQSGETVVSNANNPERKKLIIIVIIVVAVVLALMGVVIAMSFGGSSNSSGGSGSNTNNLESDETDLGWTIMTVNDAENNVITIDYSTGIPDDYYVFDGITYKELGDALTTGVQFRDEYGFVVKFEPSMLNLVASLVVMSEDEYDRLDISSDADTFGEFWAGLATLSYEFTVNKFKPESLIYEGKTDDYYFYGTLDAEGDGVAVVSFGENNIYQESQCGDYIYWKVNFEDSSKYSLGADIESLNEYSVTGTSDLNSYMKDIIVNSIKE